jgi:hypothetical protein
MIQSDEHALITGYTLGTLMRGGLDVNPEVDADGNYTDRLVLVMPEPADRTVYLRVELA